MVRYLLDRWAQERGDQTYAIFDGGETFTYGEIRARVISVAVGLARLGVSQGDHVFCWQGNTVEMLLTYYAINYLGAVYVPVNTAYRGGVLEHVIANSDAQVGVVHVDLLPRLQGAKLAALKQLVCVGGEVPADAPLPCVTFSTLAGAEADLPALKRPIEPWDTQSIIYTSGTTGPSKGVLSSYLHMYTNPGPESWYFITGADRFLVNMPFFHIGGMGLSFAMLARGGSIVVPERFSTDSFWPMVRKYEVTAVFLLGVMATFLLKAPQGPLDRDHRVKKCFIVPLSASAEEFHQRFGLDVYTIFNMTEISSPIVSEPNPKVRGTCGKVRKGVEVRLVDENDCEVALGEVGEMLVRTDRPWAMNSGYYKAPEATARAWRNGWFHTGDAFRQDADGFFFFVDRMKDAIRRRGENISSYEVEQVLVSHPQVENAAVFPVRSELAEDEVMAAVVLRPGAKLAYEALLDYCQPRMPYFAVPRYLEFVDALPVTENGKVTKYKLRERGVTAATWDREKAGYKIARRGAV